MVIIMTDNEQQYDHHEHRHRHHAEHVRLVIQVPGRESIEHEFKEINTVEHVIRWAAEHFEIKFSDKLILDWNGVTLENEKKLEHYDIPDDSVLILSDNSGGV
jgi:hypothetical protein